MQTIAVSRLLNLYDMCGFNSLFCSNRDVFLGWIWHESGMNQYALRYEKTYPAVEDWKRISYGLTQIMGDNLDVLMLDQPVDADKCLRLLHSPADQLEISREHFHKCPSHDLWDNLRYWNTGHCDDSQDGRKYIDLVMGASEYLKQKQIDSRGYYVL